MGTLAISVTIPLFAKLWDGEVVEIWAIVAYVIGIVGTFATVLIDIDAKGHIRNDLSHDSFFIPTGTFKLVLFRYCWNCLTVAAMIAIISMASHFALRDGFTMHEVRDSIVFGVVAYQIIQPIIWLTNGYYVAAILMVVLPVNMAVEFSGRSLIPHWINEETQPFILPIFVVLSICLSYVAVRARRSLGVSILENIVSNATMNYSVSVTTTQRDFKSPVEAQMWIEKHHYGFKILWFWIGFMLLFISISFIPDMQVMNDYRAYLGPAVIRASACAGMIIATGNLRRQTGAMKQFTFIRPLDANQFARARLITAIKQLGLPMAIFTSYSLITFERTSYPLEMYLFFMTFLGSWWLLWPGNVLFIACVLLPFDAFFLMQGSEDEVILFVGISALAVLCAVYFVGMRFQVKKHNVRFVLLVCMVIPLIAYFFKTREGMFDDQLSRFPMLYSIVFTMAMLLPFIATAPVIHWTRHR
jgi:hypothetical protein